MKFIIYLSVVLLLSCTQSTDTFNPFDNVFEYDKAFNFNEADSITAGCGYFNIANEQHDLLTYYQVFMNEPQVLAKGFELTIDTQTMDSTEFRQLNTVEAVKSFYSEIPVDTARILNRLERIGVRGFEIESDSGAFCRINMISANGDTINGGIDVFYDGEQRSMRRFIRFYKGRPD